MMSSSESRTKAARTGIRTQYTINDRCRVKLEVGQGQSPYKAPTNHMR
jgi:hypothetical protein